MRTLAEILPVIGAERYDVENLLARGLLSTFYEKAGRGRARRYSKENVLELAVVSALSADRRMPIKRAVEVAAKIVALHAVGKLPSIVIIRDSTRCRSRMIGTL